MIKKIYYLIFLSFYLNSFILIAQNQSENNSIENREIIKKNKTIIACKNCRNSHKKCEGRPCSYCLGRGLECIEDLDRKARGRPRQTEAELLKKKKTLKEIQKKRKTKKNSKSAKSKKVKKNNVAPDYSQNPNSCKRCTKLGLKCESAPFDCQNHRLECNNCMNAKQPCFYLATKSVTDCDNAFFGFLPFKEKN